VHPPASAGSPRRRRPRQWISLAAFASRSSMSPQRAQTCVRTLKDFCRRAPQPEPSCDVYAGRAASTRFPAPAAALNARIDRKADHPASRMLVLRPPLRLAPLCR
jgi:hypothetical protein